MNNHERMLDILGFTLSSEFFIESVILSIESNKDIADKMLKDEIKYLKEAKSFLFKQRTLLYGYQEITSSQLRDVLALDGWEECEFPEENCYKVRVMDKEFFIRFPSSEIGTYSKILINTALKEYARFESFCKTIIPQRKTTGIFKKYYENDVL